MKTLLVFVLLLSTGCQTAAIMLKGVSNGLATGTENLKNNQYTTMTCNNTGDGFYMCNDAAGHYYSCQVLGNQVSCR